MSSAKEAKYKKIEVDILSKIKDGIYKPNTLIPKEMELMEIYQVSRPTVRQAIQSLVNEGFLEKRKKRGTLVIQNKISQEFTHVIESYNDEIKNNGLSPKTRVVLFKKEQPSDEVYHNLRIQKNDSVFKLVRIRYANEQPIVLVTSYIPCNLIPNLEQYNFENDSLYSTFDSNDCSIIEVKRKLEVLVADETTADMLNVEEKDPIFYFHTVGLTNGNRPIEYSIAKYRGDMNSFEIDIKR